MYYDVGENRDCLHVIVTCWTLGQRQTLYIKPVPVVFAINIVIGEPLRQVESQSMRQASFAYINREKMEIPFDQRANGAGKSMVDLISCHLKRMTDFSTANA